MSSTTFADNADIDNICAKMKVETCSHDVFQGWWGVESKMPHDNQMLELLDDKNPCTVSRHFLNLTEDSSTRPCRIFWRKEYTRLRNKVLYAIESPNNHATGITITGQSGIGKSVFLLAMCFILLIKKREFLFLWRSQLYLFVKKDDTLAVYMTNPDRSRILSRERVPYLPVLIDTDEYQQEPPLNLTSMMLFPIQATPLEVVRYKNWMDDKIFVPFFYMDTWSKGELRQGLAANGMVADDLLSLINLYGHAILPIMKAIEFPKQAEQDQRAALDQVINIQGLTTALRETYNGVPSTTSKLLIAIRSHPGSKDKEDLSYYDFISPYIQLQLTSRLRIIELEAATHLYRSLEPWDKASSLIAWVFENVVHHILSNSLNTPVAKVFHDLHLFHPKSDEEASPITTKKAKERFPLVSTSPVFVDFSELSSLQTAISDLFSSSPTNPPVPAVYLVPENRDNSLFCSVLVEGCGCVWVIKTNMGKAHGCSQEDILPLQNLHRAIKANEGNPYYRYLCVTPTDKMTTTISSNNPSPMAKNVFYLPLCWDPITKFSSHATFELVLDNEEFDALDVDSPSLYSFNTASS